MMIYFVTGNKGKVETAKAELSPLGIEVVHYDSIEFSEPRSYDLNEIAKSKANQAFNVLQKPLMVLDAGFYINRWGDFPGPFTNHIIETLDLKGIMKLLENEKRDCEFRNALAYMDDTLDEPKVFYSSIKGIVSEGIGSDNPKRIGWSVLHKIFIPEGFDKPLSEMNSEEYAIYRKNRQPIYSSFGEWLVANR
ncbi:MAG: hypothetical protein KJ613_04815 [Nanoarchaeota archaeon]|nr:hypothetical protein [Nanoarchaeota archaeon]